MSLVVWPLGAPRANCGGLGSIPTSRSLHHRDREPRRAQSTISRDSAEGRIDRECQPSGGRAASIERSLGGHRRQYQSAPPPARPAIDAGSSATSGAIDGAIDSMQPTLSASWTISRVQARVLGKHATASLDQGPILERDGGWRFRRAIRRRPVLPAARRFRPCCRTIRALERAHQAATQANGLPALGLRMISRNSSAPIRTALGLLWIVRTKRASGFSRASSTLGRSR